MFWSLLIFHRHSTREPAPAVCNDKQDDLSCILRDHTETGVSPANTGKTRERFWKECRWMGQKGRNYQGINLWVVSLACMAIFLPTPGFKGRTFKLCVLNRWDFYSCVRCSPLRGALLSLYMFTNNLPTSSNPQVTQPTQEKSERFWKNAGEWTGRVEISKEEIPGSTHQWHSIRKTSFYSKNL